MIQSKAMAIVAAAAAVTAFPLLIIVLVTADPGAPAQAAGSSAGTAGPGGEPSALARASIPADYLTWYIGAAQTCQGRADWCLRMAVYRHPAHHFKMMINSSLDNLS